METGIELIEKERTEQLEKHGRTIERDIAENPEGELRDAAIILISNWPMLMDFPENWQDDIMEHVIKKSYKERLIIAGALIAAEIDRLNNIRL
jgi:hypothetical protein